jgi:hypothetical protein
MKTTITIAFECADAITVSELTRAVDLGTLLRDALGEFARTREPPVTRNDSSPVEQYVATRYATQTDEFRRRKVGEVEKRVALAEILKHGDITIEVES